MDLGCAEQRSSFGDNGLDGGIFYKRCAACQLAEILRVCGQLGRFGMGQQCGYPKREKVGFKPRDGACKAVVDAARALGINVNRVRLWSTAAGGASSMETRQIASPPCARRPRLKVAMLMPFSPSSEPKRPIKPGLSSLRT